MATLRHVNVWPPTGFPDRPWLEHPDEDAFARSARSVCELYSEAVQRADIAARHSELRLACHHDGGRADVLVTVHPEFVEGFELAVVLLPDGIAGLTPPDRSGLVLDVVHGAAMRMGRERGWDEAALLAAREHVLASGFRYRWEGPARTSPDRRHTAHPRYALYDDGYGRMVVEVRRRDDGQIVAVSEPVLAFSTSAGFVRSARSLRWRSRTVVELVPYAGLSAGVGGTVLWSDDHGLVRVDLEDPRPGTGLPLDEHHPETASTPEVVVQVPAEQGPRINVVGGGPMEDVPAAYETALDALLAQLGAPEWQTWWSAADARVLEIRYHFAATTAGPYARRVKDEVRAVIRRPASTFATTEHHAALARADVEAMLDGVRRRTGLGAPPPLT